MQTPGRGTARLARGLLLAAGCLMIPSAGHALVGGELGLSGPYMLVAVLLAAMCVALADRRRDLPFIAAVVGLSQPVLHVLLSLSAHGDADPWHGGLPMVAAHAVAASVVSVLLAGGEQALWVLGSLRRRLDPSAWRIQPTAVRAQVEAPRVRIDATPVRPYALLLVRSHARRGPPVTIPA